MPATNPIIRRAVAAFFKKKGGSPRLLVNAVPKSVSVFSGCSRPSHKASVGKLPPAACDALVKVLREQEGASKFSRY